MNHNQRNFIDSLNNPYLITTPQEIEGFLNLFLQLCQERQSQFIFDGSTYCQFCYQNIDYFPYQMLSCGHNVHKQCLQNAIYKQSPNLDSSMFLLGCCTSIDNQDLFEAFGRKHVEMVWDQALQQQLQKEEGKKIQFQQEEPPQPKTQEQQNQDEVDRETLELIEQLRLKDLEQQKEIEKAVEFMCDICFFTHSVEQEGITLDCEHRFCKESLSEYIAAKLQRGEFKENQIVCPRENCQTPITIHVIQNCASEEVYQKIFDLRTNDVQTYNQSETFIRCPTANCVGKYIGDPKTTPFMQCLFCEQYFCTKGCPRAHKDLTCEQFRIKYKKEMQIQGMECPKCHVMIVKEEGCNHITCTCKHQFCYLCGADWVPRKCKCKKQGLLDNIYDYFFHSNN